MFCGVPGSCCLLFTDGCFRQLLAHCTLPQTHSEASKLWVHTGAAVLTTIACSFFQPLSFRFQWVSTAGSCTFYCCYYSVFLRLCLCLSLSVSLSLYVSLCLCHRKFSKHQIPPNFCHLLPSPYIHLDAVSCHCCHCTGPPLTAGNALGLPLLTLLPWISPLHLQRFRCSICRDSLPCLGMPFSLSCCTTASRA